MTMFTFLEILSVEGPSDDFLIRGNGRLVVPLWNSSKIEILYFLNCVVIMNWYACSLGQLNN